MDKKINTTFKYFSIYLANIFLFGLIYFTLYKVNPENFVFNIEISNQEIFTDSIEANLKLTKLHEEKLAKKLVLNKIHNIKTDKYQCISSVTSENETGGFTNGIYTTKIFSCNTDAYEIILREMKSSSQISTKFETENLPRKFIQLLVYKKETDEYIFETEPKFISSKTKQLNHSSLNHFLGIFEHEINSRLSNVEMVILQLESLKFETPKWNIIDFAYFSLVSLPIGTYGDILPNSTFVRMLIIIQTLINLYILIYLINRREDP